VPKESEQDRQTRILDAAENAIAELGFAGASLRHIVREARVNLATVYYYFGSKRGLMEAVLKRRFGPLRQAHLALLRQFEQAAKGRPLPVEKILEAMLLPPLRLAATAPAKHLPPVGARQTAPGPVHVRAQHVCSHRMECARRPAAGATSRRGYRGSRYPTKALASVQAFSFRTQPEPNTGGI